MSAYILPLAVMNGLAVTILILIALLKRFVASYGECELNINGQKNITVQGGSYLNKILFENKIFIPSACGGKGTCSFCRVKIIEGVPDPLPVEEILINYKDINDGYRLSCQTKIRSNMRLELPEELLSIKEYHGIIENTDTVTRDIKRININIEEPKEGITFKSGQYILVEVEKGETRAYSISSTERLPTKVQVEVKLVPNGLGSSYLHSLVEGDKLRFFGPYGQFYLRDTSHKVVCIAGGVGLAPMKPIIFETLQRYPDRNVELYYGARKLSDLYDHDLFVNLGKNHDKFRYFPALETTEGERVCEVPFTLGFVNKGLNENLTDGTKSEAYLCGPPVMIDSAIKVLLEKGVPEIRILYDKF